MADRGIFGLLGIIAVIALIMFFMTPNTTGGKVEKLRDAARNQIHETADRLNSAFDAAKRDAQRQDH